MDDSTWMWGLGVDTGADAAVLVVVMGALVLRVLPATRRWAPRGVRPTTSTFARTRTVDGGTDARGSRHRHRPERLDAAGRA